MPGQSVQDSIALQQKQGFWPTESMSCALKESCKLVGLSYKLTTSSYRQLAIGIAKKHLLAQSLYNIATTKPKDQFGTGTEPILQRLFAWQAGHDLKEHVRSYGLDTDCPTQFSSGLLDLYWTASTAWHEWLELSSVTASIHKIMSTASCSSQLEAGGTLRLGTKRKHPNILSREEPIHKRRPGLEPEPVDDVESGTETEYEPAYEHADERTYEPAYEHTDERTYKHAYEHAEKRMYKPAYEHTDERTYEYTDEPAYKPGDDESDYEPAYEPEDEPEYEPE